MPKLKCGDVFAPLRMKNIHGAPVAVPDTGRKWVHLHFARFWGCPICNVHLQLIIAGSRKLFAAGVRQVVVFHSPDTSLLPYQGNFPFDVIGDPQKELYKQFAVETSPRFLLDPRVWPTMVRGNLDPNRRKTKPEGGMFGLPADFLIAPDGRLKAAHYGKNATDAWPVEHILGLVQA